MNLEDSYISKEGTDIKIFFSKMEKVSQHLVVPMVIDLDEEGNLLGIEIINLVYEMGNECLNEIKKVLPERERCCETGINFTYDKEADGFYLFLKKGKSVTQCSIRGKVYLNSKGSIIGFDFSIPDKYKNGLMS